MLLNDGGFYMSSRLDDFFTRLKHARLGVLMLDYDGTLAPFQVDRDKAIPHPGVREVLNRIIRLHNTRVIVISGRAISDIVPLLGLSQLPEIWGSHGWERRTADGKNEVAPVGYRAEAGLKQALQKVEASGLLDFHENCLEKKPVSLAIHWRGVSPSDVATIRDRTTEMWAPIAQEASIELHPFNGGIELRVPGRDKGFAVNAILAELKEDVITAYLGDDDTDEDAFKAIKGNGLGVLVGKEYRDTFAEEWLKPPEGLLSFLDRWEQSREARILR
jgi:trehalose 6-phosphate phosphatase